MPEPRAALRSEARRLFDVGVAAAAPGPAMARALAGDPLPAPGPGGRLILIAIGKAAPAMLSAALEAAPGATALAVTQHGNGAEVPGATVLQAGHPVPDAAGLEAARRVLALLDGAGPEDRVAALISGGGSALLPAPLPGLGLEDERAMARLLLASGLDIVAMNLVRQQISQLKGGGFLARAAPAPVTAYLLSDVIGDDIRAIASGLTAPPLGGRAEAAAVLRDAGLWDAAPEAVRRHLSDPAPSAAPPAAKNVLIGSNRFSLDAMRQAAKGARIASDALTGDVAAAAEAILAAAADARRPAILLFGGETTVVVKGGGTGGRNQELALRIALGAGDLAAPWAFLSGGTDGRDGPTDAAGGLVDDQSLARLRAAGDPARWLADNDSHAALAASGDLLVTGATGTNVADLQVLCLG